jgi:hypothetical protein
MAFIVQTYMFITHKVAQTDGFDSPAEEEVVVV